MEEEELIEWTDRLPNHPKLPAKSHSVSKKKNRVSVSPSSDASSSGEEGYVIGGGGSRGKSMLIVSCVILRWSIVYLVLYSDHIINQ